MDQSQLSIHDWPIKTLGIISHFQLQILFYIQCAEDLIIDSHSALRLVLRDTNKSYEWLFAFKASDRKSNIRADSGGAYCRVSVVGCCFKSIELPKLNGTFHSQHNREPEAEECLIMGQWAVVLPPKLYPRKILPTNTRANLSISSQNSTCRNAKQP